MSAFERITLKNGARAIRDAHSGEVMHPGVGPWAEAQRVYVEQGELAARLSRPGPGPVRVLDVGLGGGANAAAALWCAKTCAHRARPLELWSVEQDLSALALCLDDAEGFPFLVPLRADFERLVRDRHVQGDGFSWRLFEGDAVTLLRELPPGFELVFHDPFSPEVNEALWTVEVFARLRELLVPEGVLCTYSASTRTRVSMLLAGLFVGEGVGVGQKGHTTVAAASPESLKAPLDRRWLERWRRSTARAPHGRPLTSADAEAIEKHPQFGVAR